MTDEKPQVDPLTARVEKVNEAVRKLCELSYRVILDTGNPKSDADKVDIVDTLQSLGILFGTVVISLSEIADSVGKLARQGEADFKSAVDAAAAQQAGVIHEEANKRNFIGQPKRSG